jgi:hypothetical protein
MNFKKMEAFQNNQKGRFVRFRAPYAAVFNLANLNNKNLPSKVTIPAGAIGLIYSVNGGTIFIGFGKDLKTAPSRTMSPTSFPSAISMVYTQMDKLEVEIA